MKTKSYLRISQSISVMLIFLCVSCYVSGQRIGRWEKMGERTVNLSIDKEVIKCNDNKLYSAIKFRVEKSPVSFYRVTVKYTTGAIDNLNFSQLVRQGQESPVLDLRGNKRKIKEIVVYYKSEPKAKGNGNRYKEARVQIWGRH